MHVRVCVTVSCAPQISHRSALYVAIIRGSVPRDSLSPVMRRRPIMSCALLINFLAVHALTSPHIPISTTTLRSQVQSQPRAHISRASWAARQPPLLMAAGHGAAPDPSTASESSIRALQATAFVFVLSISLTTLAPAPFMVKALGERPGINLLVALATSSAVAEIGLSPLVGGLADSAGRKAVLLCTIGCQLISSLLVAIRPTVPFVAASKFVSSAVVGIFFLAGGAITADSYRTDPKKLAAVSGILFALVNLGFGVGVSISGAPFMPASLQGKYMVSVAMAVVALIAAALGVDESLPAASRVPFKAKSFNPFSFMRLLNASRKMRNLVVLAALATAPIFMGDVLQVRQECASRRRALPLCLHARHPALHPRGTALVHLYPFSHVHMLLLPTRRRSLQFSSGASHLRTSRNSLAASPSPASLPT